jgi:hypothetical protein
MKNLFSLSILFLSLSFTGFSQSTTQTIKGLVSDKQSKEPLIGATVLIMGTNPQLGSAADLNGKFRIPNVPVGRYDLKVNFIGYKEIVIPNVVLTAGKEVSLDIDLEENFNSLNEVVVSATKKHETLNEMTSVSARGFNTEEVNRYAGGRSDPSRLAANFAGVSSPNDSRNDIVVRGNSPTGVLWRIEGLNIPNPNHFATVGSTGGPVSAINTNVLRNSDFFTSAFPAEYGNANAGVFDLGFRNGNADKREHTLQLGALTGLEAMTEGPIRKESGSSYLLAYRYSFTGFAQAIGIPIGTSATPYYQDISFKINGGNTKIGKFTLFGMGGTSKIKFIHDKIDSTDLFANPTRDSYNTSDIGLIGLKHFIRVGEKSYFNTVLGATYSKTSFDQDTIDKDIKSTYRITESATKQIRYSINTSFNAKVNSRLFVKVGGQAELINLNLFYRDREFTPGWNQIWDYNDNTVLLRGYAQAKYTITERLILNAGVHSQYLTLNKSTSVEPRIGLKFLANEKNSFTLGYGLHSQMQALDVYFYRAQKADGSYDLSNKNLGFTKSQHFVLGYEFFPAKDWRVKVETYYQDLSKVPVSSSALNSISLLNIGASFLPTEYGYLANTGSGTNYGLELTIEKFFSKGYYGLVTGTIYESKYEGSDQIKRNTAFNGKFVYNILAGKEFKVGKEKRNTLTVDFKMTQAGGRYYTPVDLEASQAAGREVLKGDAYAFTERIPDFFRLDFKAGYTFNSKAKKLSQSLFFDIQNITNHQNVFAQTYNPVTRAVNTSYQIGLFPNFIYKIQF